ncbi:MAG TPA: SUF system Fe-S cluster assembly protein [Tepidisphaeraceae bacterium]|jgi:FeS assembly SUF system protein|nr:SUF system Fe-S cluster assembly protein [Tepidisphaeraceae bacterium]
MADYRTHEPVPLTVLPNSGKVDQMKREMMQEQQASPSSQMPTSGPGHASNAVTVDQKLLEGKIVAAISTVYDPEIPVNIYELGLIYKIDIKPENSVVVEMTLTAPGCPVAGTLPNEVANKIKAVDGVTDAEVVLVWEPTWDKSRMSEAALLDLGML